MAVTSTYLFLNKNLYLFSRFQECWIAMQKMKPKEEAILEISYVKNSINLLGQEKFGAKHKNQAVTDKLLEMAE